MNEHERAELFQRSGDMLIDKYCNTKYENCFMVSCFHVFL